MHDNTKELYSSLQSLIQTTSSIPDTIKLIRSVEKLAATTTDIDQVFTAIEIAEQIIYTSATYDEVIAALDFAGFIAAHDCYLESSETPSHSTPTLQSPPPAEPTVRPKALLPNPRNITPATLSDQAEATLMNLRFDGYTPKAIAKKIGETSQWVGIRTGKRPVSTAILPELAELILATDWKTTPKTIIKSTKIPPRINSNSRPTKPAELIEPTKPSEPTEPMEPTDQINLDEPIESDQSTAELKSLLELMPADDTQDSSPKEGLLS